MLTSTQPLKLVLVFQLESQPTLQAGAETKHATRPAKIVMDLLSASAQHARLMLSDETEVLLTASAIAKLDST